MSKTKQNALKATTGNAEQNLKGVKAGAISKNKQQKFKNTPTGKVALINGNKASNADKKNQKKVRNDKENTKQGNNKAVVKAEEDEIVSSKGKNPKKKNKLNQSVSLEKDSVDDSLPDIFGNSLADDTDEDDHDFDEEEEDDTDMDEFDSNVDDDDEDDDDDDDDDDEDDEIVHDKVPKKGKDVAKLKTKKQADEDDEDDDDDDDDDDDESTDLYASFTSKSGDDDDEDEDDDDDDDDDDDEEDEKAGPGLKDLLGNSIADDDDDDEDFEGAEDDDDDDDDISDDDEDSEDQKDADTSTESVKDTPEQKLEKTKRTIYIGNVPKEVPQKRIRKEFIKFGQIENMRVRGLIAENPKMSLKVAAISNKLHPQLKTVCVFITYKTEESAKAALSMNGTLFEGNYLRVDSAHKDEEHKPDPKKAIFLGNLPFTIDDNAVWKHFGDCGKIESVRIIRDSKTGVGRGIGYVNFATEDAVALALELNGTKLMNRELRVNPCSQSSPKKQRKEGNKRPHTGGNKSNSPKKFKSSPGKGKFEKNNKSGNTSRDSENRSSKEKNASFQGQKADVNKKRKGNKDMAKKKKIAAKLLVKPQKQSSSQ